MTALARARSLPMWRALDSRDFRLLWASEAVSLVGDQFQLIALSWLVISITGSGLALGTVLIAVAVPRALLLAPFGVLADRRPTRSLMLVAHLARGAIVALIAGLVTAGMATVPALVALGVVFGVADALYPPAQQAFLPRAVSADRLPSANALLQGTLQLTSIVGPPMAGVAIALAGTGVAFGVDAATFVVAAALIGLIATGTTVATHREAERDVGAAGAANVDGTHESADGSHESFGGALRAGIAYVARDPAIRTMMLLSLVLNFALNGPADVGMVWLARNRFDAGPTGLGVMAAGFAAGALAGTILGGNARLDRQGRIIVAGVAFAGLAVVAVGLLPWLPGVVVAMAALGVTIGYANVVAISWLQARTAPELLGRVMSLVMLMSFGISPLSIGVAGALIDLNATALFIGSGALVLATALLAVVVRFPAMLDRRQPSRQEDAGRVEPVDVEAGAA